MALEDNIDEIIREQTPAAEAVKALINIDDSKDRKNSSVELKTDLSIEEVKIHSVLAVINDVLNSDDKTFSKHCILGDLIVRKERKSLSKERKSRQEIVMVARQPDMPIMQGSEPVHTGMIKRMFTPRR